MKKLLYLLLGLLGFTACGENGQDGPANQMCMYGTPTMDYVVKGKVTDKAGTPIKGIVVSAKSRQPYGNAPELSAVTAADGTFVTNKVERTTGSEILVFTDTDGEANGGEFATLEKQISTLPQTQVKEGEGWYRGEYEFTADVKLEKK